MQQDRRDATSLDIPTDPRTMRRLLGIGSVMALSKLTAGILVVVCVTYAATLQRACVAYCDLPGREKGILRSLPASPGSGRTEAETRHMDKGEARR